MKPEQGTAPAASEVFPHPGAPVADIDPVSCSPSPFPNEPGAQQQPTRAAPQHPPLANVVSDFANQRCVDTGHTRDNPSASPNAQGTFKEQVTQAAALTLLSTMAAHHAVGTNQYAGEGEALKHLYATPTQTTSKTQHTNYTSTLTDVSAGRV